MTPKQRETLKRDLQKLATGTDALTAFENLCAGNVPIDVFLIVWQASRQEQFAEILDTISTVEGNPELQNLPPKQLHKQLFPESVSFEEFRNLFLEIHGGEPVPAKQTSDE